MTIKTILLLGAALVIGAVCLCLLLTSGEDASAEPLDDVVTYEKDIRPVVQSYCTTCHHGSEPEGGFVLDSYADVRKYAEKGALLARLNDGANPMPPAGLLPTHHRRLFRAWADGGFPKGTKPTQKPKGGALVKFKPPTIRPFDVRRQGFELLERMQGHWVGTLWLMGQSHAWWAFDYRAIAPSHIHGIFEGGTVGNLFTSFFVADFKGTRTLMARNGGVLNGIYRTSYLVLDAVTAKGNETRYRFVDAYGGKQIMWMELRFSGERIHFASYTSRMGLRAPTLHMRFEARRSTMHLAQAAAKAVGFPKNVPAYRFPKGLPRADWGKEHTVTSASYMAEQKGKSLLELAKIAGDPIRVDQVPHIASLDVHVKRRAPFKQRKLLLLLSDKPLADEGGRFLGTGGYLREDLANTILLFPEIGSKVSSFELTYLHPGTYYVAIIADMDGDSYPGPGDWTHPVRRVVVRPGSQGVLRIDDLNVRN